jgi:hypothetical protein
VSESSSCRILRVPHQRQCQTAFPPPFRSAAPEKWAEIAPAATN